MLQLQQSIFDPVHGKGLYILTNRNSETFMRYKVSYAEDCIFISAYPYNNLSGQPTTNSYHNYNTPNVSG